MTKRTVLLSVAGLSLLNACLLFSGQAAADPRTPALTATFSPASIALAVGDEATTVLLLQNGSEERANDLLIGTPTFVPGLEVVVATDAAVATAIEPGASLAIPIRVKRVSEGVAEDLGYQVPITYRQVGVAPGPNGQAPAQPIAQSTIAAGIVKAAAARDLLEVAFDRELDPISEDRPGEVSVVLKNPRSDPVRVTSLRIASPESVDLTLATDAVQGSASTTIAAGTTTDLLHDATEGIELSGRSQLAIPMSLAAAADLAPGGRVVVVTAEVEQGSATTEVAASLDVKVEVFGESAILGALGVPLLLLLPGLIILTVAGFLISRVGPWRGKVGTGAWDVLAKASVGAVMSVGVSLVIVQLYPTLTAVWPGTPRNLRRAYGFSDFLYIYGWSFVLAFVVWLVALPLRPLWEWAVVPRYSDAPKDLLRKLAWRNSPTGTDLVQASELPENHRLCARGPGIGSKTFVFPPMQLTGVSTTAQREIDGALQNDKVWKAWREVKKSLDGGAQIAYVSGGSYARRPAVVEADKAVPTGQRTWVVAIS